MALRLVREEQARPQARELDAAALAAAGRGEEAAGRAFLACYQDRVFTLALRLLAGDRAAAEDCAQEAFLRAFRALPAFDPRGPARASTWLLTIATRVCLDESRRRRRRPVELLAQAGVGHADPHDSHESAQARALGARVQRALAALPAE
ncbi:MAG: sigma-70 family RNA polymerase sigma factor, partial [Deltaproteobacteria bacterium]|nr:sigma-70 family RNA polymerase sigma factor [Deltaproteobacteria bacterium]